jgi:hypothetical protein
MAMIEMLRQVIEQVEHLAPDEQGIIAERFQRVLEEVAEERRWTELLHDPRTPALLDRLADEARSEYEAGQTVEGGWDEP